ncbi:MAG: hypothetical protein E7545_08460 [Ruminococcaceae bacterium]|nr:hypothetical protein [Oscillospiraceae bacterium]
MSDRKVNLVKNTALFALGNLGSKLLQIILVPYYTRAMTEAEFGTADVLQAVVALLLPLLSLTIYEAVFRYAMESDYDKNSVLSVGVAISVIGTVVLCFAGAVITLVYPIEFMWLVILNSVANAFRSLYSQYTRAVGKTALFTLDNVLITVYVLVFNILFISVFDLGITGYMFGYTLANIISSLFLIVNLKGLARVKLSLIKSATVNQMLRFSIPLIPNSICWWLSSFASRLMIAFYISESANGLFAAAYKIPSLLSVIVTIFFQAWQISANEEFKKADAPKFYTEIYNQIFALIVTVSSALIILCRPVTTLFLGKDYQTAWVYMPTLLIAMTFFSFAQFLGSIYSANKKTGMAFVTNLLGVVVNLTLSLLLIKPFGVIGCAAATAVSYFVLWVSRVFDTHKIIPIKHSIFKTVISVLLLITQCVLISFEFPFAYPISAICLLAIVLIFIKTFGELLTFGLSIVKKVLRKGA